MNEEKENVDLEPIEDIGIDGIEIALDSFIAEGIFEEIPFVKIVIALAKSGKSFKDYLLKRKILNFIKNIQDISQEEIDKFTNAMNSTKQLNEIGFKILEIIDRLDDVKKAELIGKLYKLLIKREISENNFFRMCYLIDKCYYGDILELRHFKVHKTLTSSNPHLDTEILENLFSNGLLSNNGFDGGSFNDEFGGNVYQLNNYGKLIMELI